MLEITTSALFVNDRNWQNIWLRVKLRQHGLGRASETSVYLSHA